MITTVETHWDCECEHFYIHPKREGVCPKCGAKSEDQPDSRLNEVLLQELAELNVIIDKIQCFGTRDIVKREEIIKQLQALGEVEKLEEKGLTVDSYYGQDYSKR